MERQSSSSSLPDPVLGTRPRIASEETLLALDATTLLLNIAVGPEEPILIREEAHRCEGRWMLVATDSSIVFEQKRGEPHLSVLFGTLITLSIEGNDKIRKLEAFLRSRFPCSDFVTFAPYT